MTLQRLNAMLAVLLLIVAGLASISQVDYSQPNFEILPDMKYTPAYAAYDANPNFPNGRTLQEPVAGTIPRGRLPLHYAATKEDAVRAGDDLLNPYVAPEMESATDVVGEQQQEARQAAVERLQSSIDRGGNMFRTYCVCCHGAKGAGDGQVAQRGFPPPPSLLTGNSLRMKDGQLFHILTYGQGSMERFAAQLTRDQRWDVINYVRDLQSTAPELTPPTPVSPPETDDKAGT